MINYVRCVSNTGYEDDLTVGKVYEVVEPEPNDPGVMIRVVDETGEDYLFERDRFEDIESENE